MKHVTPDEILQQAATVQSAYPELQQHLPSDTRTQTNQKMQQIQSNNQSKTNEESTQRPASKISPLMITNKPNSKTSLKITKAPKKDETNTKNLNSTPGTGQPPNSKSSIPEKKLDPSKFIFKTPVKIDQLSSNANQKQSDNSQPPSNSQPDNSTSNSQPPSNSSNLNEIQSENAQPPSNLTTFSDNSSNNSQPSSNSPPSNEINSQNAQLSSNLTTENSTNNSQPQSNFPTFSDNSSNNSPPQSNSSTLNEIKSENSNQPSNITTFTEIDSQNAQPQSNSSTLNEIKSQNSQPENSTNNLQPPSDLNTNTQIPISISNEVKSIDSTELKNADESTLREVDQSIPDNHEIINQTDQSKPQLVEPSENQNNQSTHLLFHDFHKQTPANFPLRRYRTQRHCLVYQRHTIPYPYVHIHRPVFLTYLPLPPY